MQDIATRTLRQIITLAWRAAGNTGEPTREFIRDWREANPAYGTWALVARFASGSTIATRPDTFADDPDELATMPRAKLVRDIKTARGDVEHAIQRHTLSHPDRPEYPAVWIEGQRARLADLEAELQRRDG